MGIKKLWTEKHGWCAKAAARRLEAERLEAGDVMGAALFDRIATLDASRCAEAAFRLALISTDLTPVEIDREVRRVRARAEGREVVEVRKRFRIVHPDGRFETEDGARGDATSDLDEAGAWIGRSIANLVAAQTLGARVVAVRITRRRILRAPAPLAVCPTCGGAAVSLSGGKEQPLTSKCAKGHTWTVVAAPAPKKGGR